MGFVVCLELVECGRFGSVMLGDARGFGIGRH